MQRSLCSLLSVLPSKSPAALWAERQRLLHSLLRLRLRMGLSPWWFTAPFFQVDHLRFSGKRAIPTNLFTEYFHPDRSCRKSFRQKYGLDQDDKVVISAGHYIKRKGLPEFVTLARRLPDVQFFWFGSTSLELVPHQIREAVENAPSNVHFPGYVERDEMREAYCGCDLFCFMSHEETEGIVVLETLACGTPTVVRNIQVYDGWLRDGENVYKSDSDEDFEAKVRAVLDGALPSLAAAGMETAGERSCENIAVKLRTCCEELLDTDGAFASQAESIENSKNHRENVPSEEPLC